MPNWESEELPEVMDTNFVSAMTRQSLEGYVTAARAAHRFLTFLHDHQLDPPPDARHAEVRDALHDYCTWTAIAVADVEAALSRLVGPHRPPDAAEQIARLVRRSTDAGIFLAIGVGLVDPLPEFYENERREGQAPPAG